VRPIIGIIPNFKEHSNDLRRSVFELCTPYTEAIGYSGGLPIIIPYDPNYDKILQEYTELINGLLIIGSGSDIDPAHYGEQTEEFTTKPNKRRTRFELDMLKAFLPLNKPILGICHGCQLINVAFGGSLIQHISTQTDFLSHTSDDLVISHKVEIKRDSKLWAIFHPTTTHTKQYITTNSFHHQALKVLGKNLIAAAHAEDGIIEAIELKNHPFCIGVQWHPELSQDSNAALFAKFIHTSVPQGNTSLSMKLSR